MSDIDEQSEALVHGKRGSVSGGANIQMRDGRLTSIIAWVVGVLGALSVVVLSAVGARLMASIDRQTDSINELNLTVAKVAVRLDAKDQRDDAQDARAGKVEERVSYIDGRVYTLEGRNLRGGPNERK